MHEQRYNTDLNAVLLAASIHWTRSLNLRPHSQVSSDAANNDHGLFKSKTLAYNDSSAFCNYMWFDFTVIQVLLSYDRNFDVWDMFC